jgi:hypothetical protein
MFVTFWNLGAAGRLGNQLFQIAAVVGTARRNGCDYIFPPWEYAQFFARPIPQTERISLVRYYCQPDFAYQDIDIAESTSLVGVYQSERYFQHCIAEVRDLFTPHPAFADELRSRCGSVLDGKTCSLHVRRTDYLGHPDYAELTASDYYERAIRQFDDDTTFIVFSDDCDWCKRRFPGPRFVFAEAEPDIASLFLMSLCQGHIIANSSFSWWGAWLDPNPHKKVIAPDVWFAGEKIDPAVPFLPVPYGRGFLDTKDVVPADWICL